MHTSAASFLVKVARRVDTAVCNSNMSTKQVAASRMASSTGAGMRVPLRVVFIPSALMSGRIPRSSYVVIDILQCVHCDGRPTHVGMQ